jgi:fumarate reductase (CoM/CoB) subunit A
MDHLRTDVLVVGGGGAAARAAVEAFDAGARVALVTKGQFGTGGATGYVIADFAGLAVADGAEDSTDSPELHLQDILRAGLGMCDVELSRILVEESLRVVPDLEKWGVEPERTPSGTYLITRACFSSKPRNYKLKGHGRKILEALARQVRARNVTLLERSMVVGLGKNGDQVTGGLVLSGDGTPVWIDAGAVILATGGAGQLFEYKWRSMRGTSPSPTGSPPATWRSRSTRSAVAAERPGEGHGPISGRAWMPGT